MKDNGAAHEEAQEAAGSFGADVVHKLADRIGAHAGADAVFGDAVERGGRTIIPVAQSMWGAGAGGGDTVDEGSGAGGGGGAITRPLGYIEVSDHGTTFVPLQQPWQDVKVILAYGFVLLIAMRAVNRLLRG